MILGKHKKPFGIGNYGINIPQVIKDLNGKSAVGIWLNGEVAPIEYTVGLLTVANKKVGKQQLRLMKYQINSNLNLYGSLLYEEDEVNYSLGGLHRLENLQLG